MGNIFSEGKISGRIVKLTESGVCFKTWEAELIVEGIIDNRWYFTIDSKSKTLIDKLNTKLEKGESAVLKYRIYYFTFPWNSLSGYYVYDII